MATTKTKSKLKVLLSPWAILTGILCGVIIGLYFPKITTLITPWGKIYLSLLEMCVLPIMITAIISSLGRLFMAKQVGGFMLRLAKIFSLGIIMASLVGFATGLVGKPGAGLSKDSQIILSKLLIKAESESQITDVSSNPLIAFMTDLVPKNIFSAMSKGQNLPALFFAVLFGIALGMVRQESSKTALSIFDAFFNAVLNIMGWVMYGLPFGICFLFAAQISQVGLNIMSALLRYVVIIHIAAISVFLINSVVIRVSAGKSFLQAIAALKETLIVALGTCSSFASIPSALRCLQQGFRLDKRLVNLGVPLGITLNPQGMILFAVVSTIFIAQLYNVTLGAQQLILVFVGSVFMAMAASGAPGGAVVALIAIILEPLGLPVGSSIILLIAIIAVVDPALTLVTVHANCAAATVLGRESNQPLSEKSRIISSG
ncbi:MAG TPA: dicarboxylate/amino acid:cation symporter [Desulfatiglandales bacterium]|nr:dicarboxylate/amino acid:cation symporter [Desulfatiglandales bacterium]